MSERTEAPTPRRAGEARAEGRVARSQELNAAAALLVGLWLVNSQGQRLVGAVRDILVHSLLSLPEIEPTRPLVLNFLVTGLQRLVPGLAIILLGLMVTGVVASVAQTGLLWASKRVGVDLSRLNFLAGIKRLFSAHSLVELVKALFKLLIVGWVAYSFLRGRMAETLALGQMDLASGVRQWLDLAISLAMRVGSVYMILAIADYAYQRWQFTRSMRMTKEEVKEDVKSTEGDPLIRSRIRGQQRRMARMRMMANVPKADVIITNPTHLAVAVQYNAGEMSAPKVLAKGADQVAHKIIEIARSSNVPVMQNVPLARALFKLVDIDEEIPPELYLGLAEVLAYIYRLRGKAPAAP